MITTQPGSVHMDITRVQHYPDYSKISANAPDNTPVLYQDVPFDKGSVDLFMQLEGSKSPKRRRLDSSIPRVHQTQAVDTNVGTFRESAHITTNVARNHPSRHLKTSISTVQQSKQIDTEITTVVQNQQIVSHSNIRSLQPVQESKQLFTLTPTLQQSESLNVNMPRVHQIQHLASNTSIPSGTSSQNVFERKTSTMMKKYACKFCNQLFSNITYKKYHEERKCRKNPNPTRIVCECGNKYKNMSNYEDHRSAVHGDPARHICKTCGASFQHQNGLARHKMNDHSK